MTQLEQIEKHLLEKDGITSWDAFQIYRITRLSEMIRLLRKKYVIASVWKRTPVTNTKFVEYKFVGAK